MTHHNPLFPYVYRFGTLIFDWRSIAEIVERR
jgi:hypothetical protein